MPRKLRDPAWMPAPYGPKDVDALKALSLGEATAEQQGIALRWITFTVCDHGGEPFYSDADGGERESSFASGKLFVARQITKLINMDPRIVAAMRTKDA